MTALRPAPPGLLEAFRRFQAALEADDPAGLDPFFADGPSTLASYPGQMLVGKDAIVRAHAGGASPDGRGRLVRTHVQVIDDTHALISTLTEAPTGGRGQQSQLWALGEDGWQLSALHASPPSPAYDRRIWRAVGDPLVPAPAGPDGDGPLAGESVAVKDLYAVAGHRIGAGNPDWLRHARTENDHAGAVRALLEAGAVVRGIARTDELAYAMTGVNPHYGTPPNPAAPGRVPGGSSSGSATAVSLGHATVGLGTDTGGSIRVPAAYQGLYGIRTTHGAIDRSGLLPMAPSFDAVGWMTRSAATLTAVGDVLLPPAGSTGSDRLVLAPALLRLARPEVADAVETWVRDRAGGATREDWSLDQLEDWRTAFRTWQAHEAWLSFGSWLTTRLDTLGADVRSRYEYASTIDAPTAAAAKRTVDTAREVIRGLVDDRVLVLPSVTSVAPLPEDAAAARDGNQRLLCLAGLAGLPAVSLPVRTASGLPTGVCLVAAAGRDRELLRLAAELG